MDADAKLGNLRYTVGRYRDAAKNNPRGRNAWARDIVRLFEELDSHLSAGGKPPAAWSEGPDEPYMDEPEALTTCPLGIPHTIQPIAPGVWGTPPTLMAGPDGPLDPLGGPVPGVAGSHLPEVDE